MGWPGPPTHRQYLATQTWLNLQWNQPSRADNYAMQIAYEVRRANAKNPRSVKMRHLQLRFEERKTAARMGPMTVEQVAAAKARWRGWIKRPILRVDAPQTLEG